MFTTQPRTNGTPAAGRFDDGVPERRPTPRPSVDELAARHAAQERRERTQPAPLAIAPNPADPTTTPATAAPVTVDTCPHRPASPAPSGNGAGRGRDTRLVTCDQKPGRTFTLSEAAALCGKARDRVYNATFRGYGCGGYRFRWAPGHEPTPTPPEHKADPARGRANAARIDAAKPVKGKGGGKPAPPSAPVIVGADLTGAEMGALAVALSDATDGSYTAADAAQCFEWAAHAQREFAKLRAVLSGSAALVLRDGRLDVAPRA